MMLRYFKPVKKSIPDPAGTEKTAGKSEGSDDNNIPCTARVNNENSHDVSVRDSSVREYEQSNPSLIANGEASTDENPQASNIPPCDTTNRLSCVDTISSRSFASKGRYVEACDGAASELLIASFADSKLCSNSNSFEKLSPNNCDAPNTTISGAPNVASTQLRGQVIDSDEERHSGTPLVVPPDSQVLAGHRIVNQNPELKPEVLAGTEAQPSETATVATQDETPHLPDAEKEISGASTIEVTDIAKEIDQVPQHIRDAMTLSGCQSSVALHNQSGSRELSSLHLARRFSASDDKDLGRIVLVRYTSTNEKREFAVEANILRVFAKFRHEGKATIRLKNPTYDITVHRANPGALNAFLELLYTVHTLPDTVRGLPGTANLMLNTQSKERMASEIQERMVIGSDREVPSTVPKSLKLLRVTGQGLFEAPTFLCELRHLTTLDLSHNRLQEFPSQAVAAMPKLASVNLSHNALHEMPASLCTVTLRRLDLSHNTITAFSRRAHKLTALETLVLCHNRIRAISPLVVFMTALRDFRISHNRLPSLPAELLHFATVQPLKNLDISANPFDNIRHPESRVPTRADACDVFRTQPQCLQEIAARAYIKQRPRIKDLDLVPGLATYLREAGRCSTCRGPFFERHAVFCDMRDISGLAETVTHQQQGDADVAIQFRVCSAQCVTNYLRPKKSSKRPGGKATSGDISTGAGSRVHSRDPDDPAADSGRNATGWGPKRRRYWKKS
eukprot:m.600406 g.600406  ORF g.600406 m.600406 type:complete len:736 (-) comp22432_c0_seq4:596-2803(-)